MSDEKSAESELSVAEARVRDSREVYVEPKLTYVRPELVKLGEVAKVTAGFFGTFSP